MKFLRTLFPRLFAPPPQPKQGPNPDSPSWRGGPPPPPSSEIPTRPEYATSEFQLPPEPPAPAPPK